MCINWALFFSHRLWVILLLRLKDQMKKQRETFTGKEQFCIESTFSSASLIFLFLTPPPRNAEWICFLPPILDYSLWKKIVCMAGFWAWLVSKALFTKAPWHPCAWPWRRSSRGLWSSTAAAPSLSSTMQVSRNPGTALSITVSHWQQMTQSYPPCPVQFYMFIPKSPKTRAFLETWKSWHA